MADEAVAERPVTGGINGGSYNDCARWVERRFSE